MVTSATDSGVRNVNVDQVSPLFDAPVTCRWKCPHNVNLLPDLQIMCGVTRIHAGCRMMPSGFSASGLLIRIGAEYKTFSATATSGVLEMLVI